MPTDYLPDSFANRLAGFKNLHDRIGDLSAQRGWTAPPVTDFNAFLAPQLAGLQPNLFPFDAEIGQPSDIVSAVFGG